MINRHPALLSMTPKHLEARVSALAELLGETQLQRFPALLSYIPDTLQNKMTMLTSLGLDARTAVKRFPLILTHREQAIRNRMTFFEERGLDAVRIIKGHPRVISYDVQRTLHPAIEYITKDMHRSLEEINRCPRCLGTGLEQRLKPRHKYLMLHGKRKDYSLRTICSSTDESFFRLTDQPPDYYRQWLAARNQWTCWPLYFCPSWHCFVEQIFLCAFPFWFIFILLLKKKTEWILSAWKFSPQGNEHNIILIWNIPISNISIQNTRFNSFCHDCLHLGLLVIFAKSIAKILQLLRFQFF